MSKKMHLGMILLGAGTHVAGWRMPNAQFGSENLPLIQHVVRTLERGKFDFVFFADALSSGLDAHPAAMLRFEPLTLLSALAMTTSRIGLVATVSTTYSEPYNVARAFASIDHMSKGRAGWNVVTGSLPEAAANFSKDKHPSHAERYAMAKEYVRVAQGLWDSWEDDALIVDKKQGIYVDPAKMHQLNHRGTYYRVSGPLNISRPPQGYPVVFQAGASDEGIQFAGSTAEVVFTAQQIQDEALAFGKRLRDAAHAAGRPRDVIKVICGVCPIIGKTEDEARKKVAQLYELLDPIAAMRSLSDRLGVNMSAYPLDEPVPELPFLDGMKGHAIQLASIAQREKMTLRQLRNYAAASMGHRLLVGAPSQIADDLERWLSSGAADGFAIMAPYNPGPIDEFVEHVVPILVDRGLFRQDYEGTTLRDHLGLLRPPHPLRQGRQ